MKCPNCGMENTDSANICCNCQYDLTSINNNSKHNGKRKIDIDKNADLFTIIIGIIFFGIFLFIFSELIKGFYTEGVLDYTGYLGLIIIISLFLSSFVISIYGCRDFTDGVNNILGFLLIIVTVIILCGVLSYVNNSVISSSITETVNQSVDISSLSSGSSVMLNRINFLELFIYLIGGVISSFIGAYISIKIKTLILKKNIDK
ncbi:hypothetical protein [uncultured Methanobrevibacter sp.]|uniref:hypothetical protein n=1 Tax=uncultured Methanobrevibacter sp. TaxID=253161 RepID=UPI0025D9E610|nr:hypothetical protein [uncultured Methanobrevibacter sp.]